MEGGHSRERRRCFWGAIGLMGRVHRCGARGVDCALCGFCFRLGLLVHCSTESGHKKLSEVNGVDLPSHADRFQRLLQSRHVLMRQR